MTVKNIEVFKTVLQKYILAKLSIKHDTLIDYRYGFQKVKSTTDCIFILHSLIYKLFKDRLS